MDINDSDHDNVLCYGLLYWSGVGEISVRLPNKAATFLALTPQLQLSLSSTTLKASDGSTGITTAGENLLNKLRCNIYCNGGALWPSKRPFRHDLATPASVAHWLISSPLSRARGSSGRRDNSHRSPSSSSSKSSLFIRHSTTLQPEEIRLPQASWPPSSPSSPSPWPHPFSSQFAHPSFRIFG